MHLLRLFVCCAADAVPPAAPPEEVVPSTATTVVSDQSNSAATSSRFPDSEIVSTTEATGTGERQIESSSSSSTSSPRNGVAGVTVGLSPEEEARRKQKSKEIADAIALSLAIPSRTVSCDAILIDTSSRGTSPLASPTVAATTASSSGANSSSSGKASPPRFFSSSTTPATPSSTSSAGVRATSSGPSVVPSTVSPANAAVTSSSAPTKPANPPPRPFLVPRSASTSAVTALARREKDQPHGQTAPGSVPTLTRPTTLTPRVRGRSLSSSRTPSQRQLSSRQQLNVLKSAIYKSLSPQWDALLAVLVSAEHCPHCDRDTLLLIAQRMAKKVLDFYVSAALDLELNIRTTSGELILPGATLSLLSLETLPKLYDDLFVSSLESISADSGASEDALNDYQKARRLLFLRLLVDVHEILRDLVPSTLLLSATMAVASSHIQQIMLSAAPASTLSRSLSPSPVTSSATLMSQSPVSSLSPAESLLLEDSPNSSVSLSLPSPPTTAHALLTASSSFTLSSRGSDSHSLSHSDSIDLDPVVLGLAPLSLPPPPPLSTPPHSRGRSPLSALSSASNSAASLTLSASSSSSSLTSPSLSVPSQPSSYSLLALLEQKAKAKDDSETAAAASAAATLLSPACFPPSEAVLLTLREELSKFESTFGELPLVDCKLFVRPGSSLASLTASNANSRGRSPSLTSQCSSLSSVSGCLSEKTNSNASTATLTRKKSVRFRDPLITVFAAKTSTRREYWSELLADVDEIAGDDLDDDDASFNVLV